MSRKTAAAAPMYTTEEDVNMDTGDEDSDLSEGESFLAETKRQAKAQSGKKGRVLFPRSEPDKSWSRHQKNSKVLDWVEAGGATDLLSALQHQPDAESFAEFCAGTNDAGRAIVDIAALQRLNSSIVNMSSDKQGFWIRPGKKSVQCMSLFDNKRQEAIALLARNAVHWTEDPRKRKRQSNVTKGGEVSVHVTAGWDETNPEHLDREIAKATEFKSADAYLEYCNNDKASFGGKFPFVKKALLQSNEDQGVGRKLGIGFGVQSFDIVCQLLWYSANGQPQKVARDHNGNVMFSPMRRRAAAAGSRAAAAGAGATTAARVATVRAQQAAGAGVAASTTAGRTYAARSRAAPVAESKGDYKTQRQTGTIATSTAAAQRAGSARTKPASAKTSGGRKTSAKRTSTKSTVKKQTRFAEPAPEAFAGTIAGARGNEFQQESKRTQGGTATSTAASSRQRTSAARTAAGAAESDDTLAQVQAAIARNPNSELAQTLRAILAAPPEDSASEGEEEGTPEMPEDVSTPTPSVTASQGAGVVATRPSALTRQESAFRLAPGAAVGTGVRGRVGQLKGAAAGQPRASAR
jgi:hypothetical protein